MRAPRIRLRTLLIVIAVIGLILGTASYSYQPGLGLWVSWGPVFVGLVWGGLPKALYVIAGTGWGPL